MQWLAAGVLVWLVVYAIPDWLLHHLQLTAFFGAQETRRLALTFDDGPGPDTPDVLDALRENAVQATFFVVCAGARRAPELLRRMLNEGHEIGLHGRRHVSAYRMMPWTAFHDVVAGVREVEALTGVRPTLYRPPWGHVNLGTWLAIRRLRLTPVFWQVAPDDWRADRTPEEIARRVVQWSQPGVTVVLHDAGGDRRRTVAAVGPIVRGLRSLGIEPGAVRELARARSFGRQVWTWWEIRFTRAWDVEAVPASAGGAPILRLGITTYHGPDRDLGDRILTAGNAMGEIHFENLALSRLSGGPAGGLRAFRLVVRALSDLADCIERDPRYRDLAAVGGVTLLDAQIALERAGFRRFTVRGWKKLSMWMYLTLVMAIYHHAGWSTLRRFFHLRPVLVLISREDLFRRYGKHRTRRA
ncbi:MAG: polysaccharide deacetylase family protein [Thermaerobacter sp.]|nr:polysaccharide deacetylase family protein [Thermaerobacter sp.]